MHCKQYWTHLTTKGQVTCLAHLPVSAGSTELVFSFSDSRFLEVQTIKHIRSNNQNMAKVILPLRQICLKNTNPYSGDRDFPVEQKTLQE